ncbi:MAG: GtrA family protein [Sediminibacterium sp.]
MVKPVFIKAQASSLIASAVDFLLTIFLVEFIHLRAVLAGAIGTITGGIVNFILGRNWVFKSGLQPIPIQAFRYIIVWIGNLILNVSGLAFMVNYMQANYIVSKVFISLLVGIFYNYLLQGKYVFK